MRIESGITGLDKIIDGGIPEKTSILLIGPPGCGKSTFAQQFISKGVLNNEPTIYITLDNSPNEIEDEMKSFGFRINKHIHFIDAYGWRIGKRASKYYVSNLGNLNELNILLSKVIKEINGAKVKRSVFDSISTLLLYSDPKLAVKIIPVIIAKIKEARYTQILILEEGVHDEKTINTLNYMTDGLIEFKMQEDQKYLKITRMKKTKFKKGWIKFDITKRGIVIKNV
ncbi:MAG: hypothetical protein J7K26_00510 [Candidatus Aenigmarchaeota archaeon]|nr:hypothetical protein [Candidatus Aenigmarchaeota archaeon]